jgi:hypothetical protein
MSLFTEITVYGPGEPGPVEEPEELRSRWRAALTSPSGGLIRYAGPSAIAVFASVAADLEEWSRKP